VSWSALFSLPLFFDFLGLEAFAPERAFSLLRELRFDKSDFELNFFGNL
jgi:hypothetical protein